MTNSFLLNSLSSESYKKHKRCQSLEIDGRKLSGISLFSSVYEVETVEKGREKKRKREKDNERNQSGDEKKKFSPVVWSFGCVRK